MKQKRVISFLLTGLFLINLFVLHSGGLVGLFTGDSVRVVNPFCKKSKAGKTGGNSETIEYASVQGLEIPVICTSVIDFKDTSFRIIVANENFRKYSFHNKPYSEICSDRDYIPPRV